MGLLRTMTVPVRTAVVVQQPPTTTAMGTTNGNGGVVGGTGGGGVHHQPAPGSGWNKRMRHLSSPILYLTALLAKARRKEKADVAGVTGGPGAGLSLGGLAGSVSLPGGGGPISSFFSGAGSLLGTHGAGHQAASAGQFGGCDADHKLYLESTVLERKVPEADLRQLIDLPPGLDLNEWLASHTIAFFEHVNLLYGAISEYCTTASCPDMLGPGQRQYTWIDEKGKKIRLSAPQYIDSVMTYAQRTVNDESIFPTKFGQDFPPTYEAVLRKIHRLLFHVVAHLYHRHFRELLLLGLHGHLHGLFAHLILFNSRFRLIDDKETEILHDLVIALRLQPDDKCAETMTTPTTSQPLPVACRSSQPSPTTLQQQQPQPPTQPPSELAPDQSTSIDGDGSGGREEDSSSDHSGSTGHEPPSLLAADLVASTLESR